MYGRPEAMYERDHDRSRDPEQVRPDPPQPHTGDKEEWTVEFGSAKRQTLSIGAAR